MEAARYSLAGCNLAACCSWGPAHDRDMGFPDIEVVKLPRCRARRAIAAELLPDVV